MMHYKKFIDCSVFSYMAPELMITDMDAKMIGESIDIFSFGITMWACFSHEHPYR